MPRPSQQLHPVLQAPALRMAATVLLLRDTPQGMEVLMTRRSGQASFAANLYVFPGGAVDAADHAVAADATLLLHAGRQPGEPLVWALAAIRESFEEIGVLLARRTDGSAATQAEVDALHVAIGRRSDATAFYTACRAAGLRLDASAVQVLARWTAPLDIPKRFDTPFLIARMPPGQTAQPDEHEQFEPRWVRPAEALALHAQRQFAIMFPTVRTLQRIAPFTTVDALFAACGHGPLWHYQPRGALLHGKETRITNDEQAFGEIGLVTPHGQVAHALQWQHEHAVPLLRNVQRLTAPNANVMTGPGTNSYLVGTAASGYIAIDPGPADPGHVQRLLDAAGGDIRAIVCTHSHPDHSPGAPLLQALCVQRGNPEPPVHGMASGPHARADSRFAPDAALADGDRLTLREPAGATHTLLALHTPGHTANHLCLALLEDGLLLSGDHILNGSTPVIMPPDGHMGDYLASLDKLAAACATHGLKHILPAHGHVLQDAPQVIAQLKAHRLAREAKVRTAMTQLPAGSVEDWVALAYADTPRELWPLARHSLLAHVAHLREQG